MTKIVVRLRECDRCHQRRASVKRRQGTVHFLCASCWAKKKARARKHARVSAEGWNA